jgi:hypothetical protein
VATTSSVEVPVLTANAESPADFASGSADIAVIGMPTGVLFGAVLRFELKSGSKDADHHIFDMSLPQHADFWKRAHAARGAFAISIENTSKQQGARLDLSLEAGRATSAARRASSLR